MPNFASIINSHGKKILNENTVKPTSALCNCRVKVSCPLDDNCLQSSLVYIWKAAGAQRERGRGEASPGLF